MDKKTDKGSEMIYWKLSRRRKFIRTLWMIPISIAILVFTFIYGYSRYGSFTLAIILAILMLILLPTQVIYTYKQWKKEEENEKSRKVSAND